MTRRKNEGSHRWPGLVLAAALSVPFSAAAEEPSWKPFVVPEHYLGNGNAAVTIEDLTADPRSYFRNDTVYAAFMQRFGVTTTPELQKLLRSDDVTVKKCDGEIRTNGEKPNGTIGWYTRPCYEDEWLIVLVDRVRASLGCLNGAKEVAKKTKTKTKTQTGVPHQTIESGMLPPARGGYLLHLQQRCKSC